MNVIEFKLCAEDRQRIDELIAFAGQIVDEMKSRPAAEHPADAPTTHLEPPVAAAPAAIQPEPAAVDPAPEVKPVSLGEFQKAIVTRCAASAAMKAKVQALVHKYAPSVSEIPEDKRAEVLAELAKL